MEDGRTKYETGSETPTISGWARLTGPCWTFDLIASLLHILTYQLLHSTYDMPEALGAASKALVRPVHGRRHLQERRRNEAQELATRSTPLAHSFEIGGKAARAAYDNQEVMRHILELVDRSTLISLFRLEKAALGMVAEVVYEEIHVDSARRMNGQKNVSCFVLCNIRQETIPERVRLSVANLRSTGRVIG